MYVPTEAVPNDIGGAGGVMPDGLELLARMMDQRKEEGVGGVLRDNCCQNHRRIAVASLNLSRTRISISAKTRAGQQQAAVQG